MWPEVQNSRYELVLTGAVINERLQKDGLDNAIFSLNDLNYLSISEAVLSEIPNDVENLKNLQTLVLHSNKLEKVNEKIGTLEKLKILDLSRNTLENIPDIFKKLVNLATLNLYQNSLTAFPELSKNTKLTVLDLSNNKLSEFPMICKEELANLAELKLNFNEIEMIPNTISVLPSLKLFEIHDNKIKVIPGELADCHKLKEVNLKNNPISDKRLFKLIDQCRTKQVIDYVKQHCVKTSLDSNKNLKKGKKTKKNSQSEENEEKSIEYKYTINVNYAKDEDIKVKMMNSVKTIRQYIVCCLVNNVKFTDETYKKFIQIQNKLHDTACEKRNAATIATHDFKKISQGDLTYTTSLPGDLKIKPLNRVNEMTGLELFSRLQVEANNLRKEKKRNTYGGVHKYLYLIEGKPHYPCLMNSSNDCISFPPITNSDISKISVETTQIFVEITSSTGLQLCKTVLDSLLKEMVLLFENDLSVTQIRIVDQEDQLKIVYPSKTDLIFDASDKIKVNRS